MDDNGKNTAIATVKKGVNIATGMYVGDNVRLIIGGPVGLVVGVGLGAAAGEFAGAGVKEVYEHFETH